MRDAERSAVVAAVQDFYVALNAMLQGDPEPLKAVASHADDVTFLPAQGGILTGWETIYRDWEFQASLPQKSRVEVNDIHVFVSGDMAAALNGLTGHFEGDDGESISFAMRESHVYRKEDGQWKMIVQHADQLPHWTELADETRSAESTR